MKNLDLNAYGVQEMNHQEMVETDGGGWLANIGVGLAVAGMVVAAATGVGLVAGAIAVASVVVASAAADDKK